MHVPQGILHDTSSQLTSPAFAAAALKVIEMDGHSGRRKNEAFVVYLIAIIKTFL